MTRGQPGRPQKRRGVLHDGYGDDAREDENVGREKVKERWAETVDGGCNSSETRRGFEKKWIPEKELVVVCAVPAAAADNVEIRIY